MMKLDRPLCVFDLEATGTDPLNDRIVDVCVLRYDPDGKETLLSSLVDPGVPIPAESTAIHHITDAMVRGEPAIKDLAPRLLEIFEGADLSGFNAARYDIPLLTAELKRAGFDWPLAGKRVVDSFTIFARKERRDLSAAYKFYCGKEHGGAHRAEACPRTWRAWTPSAARSTPAASTRRASSSGRAARRPSTSATSTRARP